MQKGKGKGILLRQKVFCTISEAWLNILSWTAGAAAAAAPGAFSVSLSQESLGNR